MPKPPKAAKRTAEPTSSPREIVSFRAGELLPRLHEGEGTPGPIAKRDLSRYYELLAEYLERLSFTEAEALLLCDAADELLTRLTRPGAAALPVHRWLWAEVADAIRAQGLDEKYGLKEPEEFIERVRSMEPAEGRAVIDALERYRAARARGDKTKPRELLARLGLIRS